MVGVGSSTPITSSTHLLFLPWALDNTINTGVTSENHFQVLRAFFFPLPWKHDTVSYPVNAWNAGSASAVSLTNGLVIS